MLRTALKNYLGFPCSSCREPITVFTVAEGVPTPRFMSDQYLTLACPKCGTEDRYSFGRIARYQEHQIR